MSDFDYMNWLQDHIGIDRFIIRLRDGSRTFLICGGLPEDATPEVISRHSDLRQAIRGSIERSTQPKLVGASA